MVEEVHLVLIYLTQIHDLMKLVTGQQNMFSVGALEASFRKVDSNAAGAIPFLPFFSTFLTSFDLISALGIYHSTLILLEQFLKLLKFFRRNLFILLTFDKESFHLIQIVL